MGGKELTVAGWRDKRTEETKGIVRLLEQHFRAHPKRYPAAADRYNPASNLVRDLDEALRGQTGPEREKMVLPFLQQLPDDTYLDITLLLLLTPEEVKDSLMNLEFELETPSKL